MDKLKAFGKTLLKWGFIGLALIIGIKLLFGGGAKKAKAAQPSPVAVTATTSQRVYAKSYNFSDMEGDAVMLKIDVPAGQWVSVKMRMGYDVNKKPSAPMAYDYGNGRVVHDAPGKKIDSGDVPNAFDVMGEGQVGTLELRCYRIPSTTNTPTPKSVVEKQKTKEVKFASQKKVRPVTAHRKDREPKDDDIPRGPQIM